MLRFAIFGAGQMGRVHARSIAGDPNALLHSVVDISDEAAQNLATQYGAKVEPDAETALADPALDAVIISAPSGAHLDLVLASAQAGKAVFCEKPLAEDVNRAKIAVEQVLQTGVPTFMGFMKRFWPGFRSVEERLRAGLIGDPEIIILTNRDPQVTIIDYLVERHDTAPYCLLRESTVHDFDMARALLGEEPVEVFVASSSLVHPRIAEVGEIDTVLTTLQTASGKLCVINNSWRSCYGYDQRVEVMGSKGMLRAENRPETSAVLYTPEGALHDRLYSGPPDFHQFYLHLYAPTYPAELAHFIEVVEKGVPAKSNVVDGLRAQMLVEAAVQSVATGLPVKVPE